MTLYNTLHLYFIYGRVDRRHKHVVHLAVSNSQVEALDFLFANGFSIKEIEDIGMLKHLFTITRIYVLLYGHD